MAENKEKISNTAPEKGMKLSDKMATLALNVDGQLGELETKLKVENDISTLKIEEGIDTPEKKYKFNLMEVEAIKLIAELLKEGYSATSLKNKELLKSITPKNPTTQQTNILRSMRDILNLPSTDPMYRCLYDDWEKNVDVIDQKKEKILAISTKKTFFGSIQESLKGSNLSQLAGVGTLAFAGTVLAGNLWSFFTGKKKATESIFSFSTLLMGGLAYLGYNFSGTTNPLSGIISNVTKMLGAKDNFMMSLNTMTPEQQQAAKRLFEKKATKEDMDLLAKNPEFMKAYKVAEPIFYEQGEKGKEKVPSSSIESSKGEKIFPDAFSLSKIKNISEVFASANQSVMQKLLGKIPVSVLYGQMALESGGDISTLARKYNNFFGIKWRKGMKGARPVSMATNEEYNGKMTKIQDNFAHFDTPEACFRYYIERMMNPPSMDDSHYAWIQKFSKEFDDLYAYKENNTWKFGKKDKVIGKNAISLTDNPVVLVECIRGSGYATDSQYANKVASVLSQQKDLFHLTTEQIEAGKAYAQTIRSKVPLAKIAVENGKSYTAMA